MNSASVCACKGIRKCALCAPDLIEIERINEQTSLKSKKLFIYCPQCAQSTLIPEEKLLSIESFLEGQNDVELCFCGQAAPQDHLDLNGIFLLNEFISRSEEILLTNEIYKSKWTDSQSGRFKQDFGPKANFNKKKLKFTTFTGLPYYSRLIMDKFVDIEALMGFRPVELCNLRYEPERAACIDPHYDDFWLWGERLVTVNLNANTFLKLTPGLHESLTPVKDCEVLIPLRRRSLVVLTKEARFKWMHSISKAHIKSTRLAITLRELSGQFADDPVGAQIERLALTFKGVSVGFIEELLTQKREIQPIASSSAGLIDQQVKEKLKSFFVCEDPHLPISSIELNEAVLFKVGEHIAQWPVFAAQV